MPKGATTGAITPPEYCSLDAVKLLVFVVALLPSRLAVGMLIHPTMVQCTP